MAGARARATEIAGAAGAAWSRLSLDAKLIGTLAIGNWVLLLGIHEIIAVEGPAPLWTFFPGALAAAYLAALAIAAVTYPLRDLRDGERFTARRRAVHLAVLVGLFVILPTLVAMLLRGTGQPYTYVHDGAIMAEEAARKLLVGLNPYSVDYVDTPLFYWPMANNPALYHFTYFPLLFLLTVPPLWIVQGLTGWFDVRLLFVPAALAAIMVGAWLVRGTTARLCVAALLALNPQFFPFVVEGRNDGFVLLFVMLTAYFLMRERPALAGLALAVAAGTKLHAVVLVPFVAIYLLARARPRSPAAAARALAPAAVPFGVVSAVVFLPFLAWDLAAFYDDIVAYNAGSAAWSYPVSGVGFSALLHGLGLIPHRNADFPLWIFQAAVALPVIALALRRLWREPTISALLLGYAVTLLAFLFFGRYFQTSYFGYILAVAVPAFFMRDRLPRRVAAPATRGAAATAAAGD